MKVNHLEQPVIEEPIYDSYGMVAASTPITDDIRDRAIALLCEKLRVSIVMTNATKHGSMQLVLREEW